MVNPMRLPAHPRLVLLLATVTLAAGLVGDVVGRSALLRATGLVAIVLALATLAMLLPALASKAAGDDESVRRAPSGPCEPGPV